MHVGKRIDRVEVLVSSHQSLLQGTCMTDVEVDTSTQTTMEFSRKPSMHAGYIASHAQHAPSWMLSNDPNRELNHCGNLQRNAPLSNLLQLPVINGIFCRRFPESRLSLRLRLIYLGE